MIEEITQLTEEFTLKLTKIQSIVGTEGEIEIARFIFETLDSLQYFKDNPENLRLIDLEDDHIGRKYVFAHLRSNRKSSQKKGVILIGHIDTVGIEDYGDFGEYSTDPKILEAHILNTKISDECKQDIESGQWLFGRGIFDMKCGVAANMALIHSLSKNIQDLEGDIIFLALPDEEGNSMGMLSSLSHLKKIKDEMNVEYQGVVDTDYMAPRYQGDECKYIYIGSVGKLLPCFYVIGKETHVGEAFEGLDPNLLASELVREIDLSEDLCDIVEGESTVPPISLKQQDLKLGYSVQTASCSVLYFNYSTHSHQPDRVISLLKEKSIKAFDAVIERLNKNYKLYCRNNGIPYSNLLWKTRVYTYEEYYKAIHDKLGKPFEVFIETIKKELLSEKNTDDRLYSLKLIQAIQSINPDKDPAIVIYYSPPYYPHVHVDEETNKGKRLTKIVQSVIEEIKGQTYYNIGIKKFYPYISDLSYCSITKNDDEFKGLIDNMPAWPEKYILPVEGIRALNLPVVNIGPFGKDAHKFTERLHKPYSFGVMPRILYMTVKKLLENSYE